MLKFVKDGSEGFFLYAEYGYVGVSADTIPVFKAHKLAYIAASSERVEGAYRDIATTDMGDYTKCSFGTIRGEGIFHPIVLKGEGDKFYVSTVISGAKQLKAVSVTQEELDEFIRQFEAE
ncbi:hypothetical protein MQM1_062 [Aeromonas phage vB_AsaP_MQM1]|nr:hypothetical protein MQM1_062 [Aeromonas phage vB_AsaP_MQM1]